MKKIQDSNRHCVICKCVVKAVKANVSPNRTPLCKKKKCIQERRRERQQLRRKLKREQLQLPFVKIDEYKNLNAFANEKKLEQKLKFFAQVVD